MAVALDVPLSEAELQLMEVMGGERGMLELIKRCGECEDFILVPDNDVWLDIKPLPAGHDYPCPMGIMQMGSLRMAAGGDLGSGSQHRLHDHQPPEKD